MAKVDTIQIEVDGKRHSYNINVGKEGVFRCMLDIEVSEVLGLDRRIVESTQLDTVRSIIKEAERRYINSSRTLETYIWIVYQSSGEYGRGKDGYNLFGHGISKYKIDGFNTFDSLAFEFGVVLKETIGEGDNVVWYDTMKGQGCVRYDEADLEDPDTYYRNGINRHVEGKLIPYSDQAINTLTKAQQGIRSISEILFHFIEQDEKLIESALLGGNLLPDHNTVQ